METIFTTRTFLLFNINTHIYCTYNSNKGAPKHNKFQKMAAQIYNTPNDHNKTLMAIVRESWKCQDSMLSQVDYTAKEYLTNKRKSTPARQQLGVILQNIKG